jgi:hypothetical protein
VQARNAYIVLVGKQEGTRPVGKPMHIWEDNIHLDLKEIGWEGMYWICHIQDRDLVNMVMN